MYLSDLIDAENIFDGVKCKIWRCKKNQREFESKLSSVTIGGNKSKKQLSDIENITKIYKSREGVIKFYNTYFKMIHKAAYDSKLGKGLKILTAKQMLQKLPMVLEEVKSGNPSENLLNEIIQILYSLYQEEKVTKKVYNNKMNSIKLLNRMDTIFMNSKRSETSDPHRLLLNLTDKLNLKRSDK